MKDTKTDKSNHPFGHMPAMLKKHPVSLPPDWDERRDQDFFLEHVDCLAVAWRRAECAWRILNQRLDHTLRAFGATAPAAASTLDKVGLIEEHCRSLAQPESSECMESTMAYLRLCAWQHQSFVANRGKSCWLMPLLNQGEHLLMCGRQLDEFMVTAHPGYKPMPTPEDDGMVL